MIRTFAAIPLAAEVAAQIGDLQRQLQQLLPEVRWTRPQTLHLTLRFFGDLPEESLETVGEIMLSIGRLHAPFCLDLGGVGAFPGPHRARVFWLGVRNPGPLQTLHHELERQLPLLGIPRESRPFAPHLTLGRHRGQGLSAAPVLSRFADATCGPLPVDRMILFESRLQPSGARHLPRRTIPLCGPGGG